MPVKVQTFTRASNGQLWINGRRGEFYYVDLAAAEFAIEKARNA
jgi:hypothetical protein